MFEPALRHFREGIRRRQYVMTLHAEEQMYEDGLSVHDVERAMLTGRVLEHQKNGLTGEAKYRIIGRTMTGDEMEIIAKFGPTGKVVIITVYLV